MTVGQRIVRGNRQRVSSAGRKSFEGVRKGTGHGTRDTGEVTRSRIFILRLDISSEESAIQFEEGDVSTALPAPTNATLAAP